MKEGEQFILSVDINSFFSKGDLVTVVSDWEEQIYITNGFHRVCVDRTELLSIGTHKNRK